MSSKAWSWKRVAVALAVLITVSAGGIGVQNAAARPSDDDDPGWKCQGCEALRCPDVGSLVCFRGEVTVNIGPFGSITGEVVCYQGPDGSEGPGCSDTQE